MFQRIRIVGRGRVGGAVAGRLQSLGLLHEGPEPDLIVFCVPDGAIAELARTQPVGPWVAHVSGATPLAALDPHRRRFTLHPLQTFARGGGESQLDGAWAAVTAAEDETRVAGHWLAGQLGLLPFDLADDQRAMYHAGAVMASNFLVTLHRAAAEALATAGVPPEALVPLMRRTIDNGFELTGPIERGDWVTVEAHRAALAATLPALLPLYDVLTEATRP